MKYFYEKTTQVLFTVNESFTKLNNYQPRFHPFYARVQYRGKTFEASCVPCKNLNGQAGNNGAETNCRIANILSILLGWFSNRTETSVEDGKARGKD